MPSDKVKVKARWMDGQRGKGKVLVDPEGHKLRFKKTELGKKYYVCSRRADLKCPVAVTLKVETDMIVRVSNEHNHDNDILKETVRTVVNEKIESAVSNRAHPRAAFMNITNKLLSVASTSAGLPYLPKMTSVARKMNREKEKSLDAPPIPHEWSDMELPEIFKTTTDNGSFNIMDYTIPGTDKKIWGFSSDSGLEVMKTASDLYADGTFEFVDQTLFTQVYVIVARLANKQSIPTAFYMLPAKDFQTYKLVLENMKARGINAPQNFHIDFESAAIKAIKSVYPESQIVACDTHWKRAIRTNIQKSGLMVDYNQDIDFQTFIRKLWSLSLVPIEDVVNVWEQLQTIVPVLTEDEAEEEGIQEFNNCMDKFLLYFEQTWIGSKNPRTNLRGKPKFEFKYWNKYNQVLAGEETTNNVSEAWNSASKLSLQMKPSIWAVLHSIKKEEELARFKVNMSAMGVNMDSHRGRTERLEQRKERLRGILNNYGRIPLNNYLDMTASFFND